MLLARVISKPGGNRICIDLGHKAVASENPLEHRVVIPELFVGVVDSDRVEPHDARLHLQLREMNARLVIKKDFGQRLMNEFP